MAQIDKVISKQTPTLLDASKANELIGFVNGLLLSKGKGVVNVIVEDTGRIVVSIDGYTEISVIICDDDDGASVQGKILFKID